MYHTNLHEQKSSQLKTTQQCVYCTGDTVWRRGHVSFFFNQIPTSKWNTKFVSFPVTVSPQDDQHYLQAPPLDIRNVIFNIYKHLHLTVEIWYSGEFQALQLSVLAVFGAVD